MELVKDLTEEALDFCGSLNLVPSERMSVKPKNTISELTLSVNRLGEEISETRTDIKELQEMVIRLMILIEKPKPKTRVSQI